MKDSKSYLGIYKGLEILKNGICSNGPIQFKHIEYVVNFQGENGLKNYKGIEKLKGNNK